MLGARLVLALALDLGLLVRVCVYVWVDARGGVIVRARVRVTRRGLVRGED